MGEADAAKDAIASATSLVDLEAALTNAVKVATPKPAAKAAKTAAKAPAPAKVAKEVPVKVAKPTVDTTGLADLVTLVRNLEQDLAAALGKRNAEMASLYATGNVSFAKLADVVGVSPMAARAMVGRA
jgi:diaminopimelate epimerase